MESASRNRHTGAVTTDSHDQSNGDRDIGSGEVPNVEGAPRIPLVDRLPARWSPKVAGNTFWVSGYRTVFGDPSHLIDDGGSAIDLGDVVLVVVSGSPIYFSTTPLQIAKSTPNREVHMRPIELEQKTLDEGIYVRVISPLATSSGLGNEEAVRARIDEVVGLAAMQLGRSTVFEKLFEYVADFSAGSARAWTVFKAPDGRMPKIDKSSLSELLEVEDARRALPPHDQARIALGLRWYLDSFEKADGIDSFLSRWFAIETVAMRTTKVKEIDIQLARAYGITVQDARMNSKSGRCLDIVPKSCTTACVPRFTRTCWHILKGCLLT
jgi:hypothetical protein